MSKTYDAVIVGGGPSGHSCAVRIAQLGGQVAIVERDFIGGICTNWGCTPSKAMIESAKVAREVKEGGRYGVKAERVQIDFKVIAKRRNQVVRDVRAFITDLLQHYRVDLFQGEGLVRSLTQVLVRSGKLDPDGYTMTYTGQEEELAARNIVIATGSQPLMPSFVASGDPSLVNSNRLISINELPRSLVIVGGGVIGMEFATIFSNLGSQVTVVEFLPRLLAAMDPDVSGEITARMQASGVRILTNHKVTSVREGTLTATDMGTNQTVQVKAQMFLIAIGRKAVVHEEAYTRLGIQYTPKGVGTDDALRTNVPGIWAIGDATGKSILAHAGIQQGIITAENIMRKEGAPLREMDYGVIPAIVYSIPEIAMVGNVPQDLQGVDVYQVPFTKNLRANIEEKNGGFIKIWVKDRRLLAAQAIGNNVSEFFQELTNLVALKTDIGQVAEIVHAHPTYSEITRSILDLALGRAVDFYL
jgi:dihydrolipoamide dehydrogenase